MSTEIPKEWQTIAKIFTQELCPDECEWCLSIPDPYGTGDHHFVQHECTVPVVSKCPCYEDYVEENL